MQDSDEMLMQVVQESADHAAFSALVTRHAGRFRHVAYGYVCQMDVAEDIVQSAFLSLWQSPHMWNAKKNTRFTTWFHRIVVNRSIDHMRKYQPLAMHEDQEFEDLDQDMADDALEAKRRQQQFDRAFMTMSPKMQMAIGLAFFDHVPNKDAAEVMGLSLKAYQSLLMRAKAALRKEVSSYVKR